MAWPSSLAECNRAPWPSYCVRVRSLIGVLASSLLATLIKLPRFSTPRRTAGRLAVEGAGPCPCTPLSLALPRPATPGSLLAEGWHYHGLGGSHLGPDNW